MTTAVVATGFGGPENLAVIDSPVAAPAAGEVTIAVRAAGVNPIDWKSYSGLLGADPAALPIRLGLEVAGVVTASASARFGVGDEVIAYRVDGGYAAEVTALEDAVIAKPAGLDWDVAAGLLLVGGTATHALVAAGVTAGDTVLVHGGAGGVGLVAVQLAALRGASVIATASEPNHDLLRELGATPVSYGPGLLERVRAAAPGGVDAALDLVGTDEAIDASLALVVDRNHIATIAAFGRGAQEGIKVLGGQPGADPGTEVRTAARPDLAALAADGQLRLPIAARYPLTEAPEAHRVSRDGHTVGKIVLVP